MWSPDEDAAALAALAAIVSGSSSMPGIAGGHDRRPAGRAAREGSAEAAARSRRTSARRRSAGANARGRCARKGVRQDRGRPAPPQGRPRAVRAVLPGDSRTARVNAGGRAAVAVAAANPSRATTAASFPQLSHDLPWRSGDALLRAACAFIDDGKRIAAGALPRAWPKRLSCRGAQGRPEARRRSRAALISCCRFRRSTPPSALERFVAEKGERAAALSLPAADRRPRPRQARPYAIDLSQLEDPLLETSALGKTARDRRAADHARDPQHPGIPAGVHCFFMARSIAPLLADAQSILASTSARPAARRGRRCRARSPRRRGR